MSDNGRANGINTANNNTRAPAGRQKRVRACVRISRDDSCDDGMMVVMMVAVMVNVIVVKKNDRYEYVTEK